MRYDIQPTTHNGSLCYKQYNQDPTSKKLFMCSTCDEVFDDISTLISHKKTVHSKPPYPSRQRREIHPQQINNHMDFICSYCPFGYKRKIDREKHEEIHHSGSCPYTCDFCWCSFNNSEILKSHIFRFHNEIKNEISTNVTLETKVVENQVIIKRQTRSSGRFKIQPDSVIQKTPVIRLQRCIVDSNLLKGSSTSKMPAAKMAREKRKRGPHNAGPAPKFQTPGGVDMVYANDLCCSYCPKFFAYKDHKLRHERFHNGDWQHTCEFCPATFYLKDMRNLHQKSCRKISINTHLWCDYCDFHTRRKDFLKIHYSKRHALNLSKSSLPQSNDKPVEFSCNICDASFTSENMLKRHQWKSHQKNKQVNESTGRKKLKKIVSQNSIEEHTIIQREIKNNIVIRENPEGPIIDGNISEKSEYDEISMKLEQFGSSGDQQISTERDSPVFNFCEVVYDPLFEVNFPKMEPNVSIKQELAADPLKDDVGILENN